MIIILKNADFSKLNIGTLSTWRITRSLGTGASYEGVTSVDKGAAFSASVTIAEGYELGTAGVTVTMGGTPLTSGVTVNGNTITITIAAVTGNVTIKVPTVNLSTGEEEEPEIPDAPSGDDLDVVNYTYELGKSIQTTSGETLEGDSYKHLTLITIPKVNKSNNLAMKLTDGYSYKVFYYKGDTFVGALDSNYLEVKNTSASSYAYSWWIINGYSAGDYDTIKVIYKKTSGSASTTPATSPTDIDLELAYKYINGYEIGWSLSASTGCLLYDEVDNKYSHIASLKPIAYSDNLKFSINSGYMWAIYAFDSNMKYLGTHDGATTSPWEAAVSNYAVSAVKTKWTNTAYVAAAYKATDAASGGAAVTPSVAGARFHQ